MMLDIKTLMMLYLIINVISAGAVAVIWSQHRGRFAGITFWLIDMILQAAGSLLLVLRGLIPDLISMTGSNTIILAGALIILMGLERFTGKKGWQIHNYILLAIFMAVSAYFVLVQPDLTVREIALSVMTVIFTFQCCWLLLRRVAPGMRQITRLTGIIFAGYVALNSARIILTIITPEQTNDFFKSGAVSALAITGYIVLSACLTISLVLMVNRRLLADVKTEEEALRESEGRYRNILEQMQDSYYEVDLSGNYTYVNESTGHSFGYSQEEMIGRNYNLTVPEEDIKSVFAAFNTVYRTGKPNKEFSHRILRKDGTIIFSEVSIDLNRNAQGDVVGFKCVSRDITGRKQAEEALRASEERFQLAIAATKDGIWEWDIQSNQEYFSPRWCEIIGYSFDDPELSHTYNSWASRIHPDDLDRVSRALKDHLETGARYEVEYRHRHKSGEYRWQNSRGQAIFDKIGKPVKMGGCISDITERKQAEEALRESEEKFKAMVETIPMAIYLSVGVEQISEYISPTMVKLFGYTMEDIPTVAQWWPLAYPDETYRRQIAEEWTNRIKRAIETQSSIEPMETVVTCKNSAKKNILWGYITMGDKNYAFGLDLTDRKLAEEALRESEEKHRAVVELASDAIVIIQDGIIMFANPRVATMFGYETWEIEGIKIANFIPRTNLELTLERYQKRMVGEKLPEIFETAFIHKSGAIIPVETNGSVIQYKGRQADLAIIRDITERNKAAKEVRASQQLLNKVISSLLDPLFIIDANTVEIIDCNPAASVIFGYTREEMVGKTTTFLHVDQSTLDEFRQNLNSAVEEKGFLFLPDYLMRRKDASIFPTEHSVIPILDEKGKRAGWVSMIRDITDRKQAEESLRESEERFRMVLRDVHSVAVQGYSMDGTTKFWNEASSLLYGYTAEEAIGKNLLDLIIPPEMREDVRSAITSMAETGQPIPTAELQLMRKDTSLVPVLSSHALIIRSGRANELFCIDIDLTEIKKAEEALKESEEKYRVVVENAQESILVIADGMLKFANRSASELSGYSAEEFNSKSFIEFIHPDDRQIMAELYLQRLKGKDVPKTNTFRGISKQGDIHWMEVTSTVITWEGKPATLYFMTDITDRKRLEEEQQRVAKLESVGLLAGGIAHDFNNILTSILGNISLASMEAAPGSELQNSLEQAEKASQRAKALTVQLLTFSKGGAPVLKLASLTELIKDTADFALSGSKVKCHFSIPHDLWHAEIDAGQVSQIIHNLVINAQQAMPIGGSIEISAENIALSETQRLGRGLPLKSGNYVRVSVADHGTGIPGDHLEKIFDPFFTTKQKGNGMGLAISFSIARQHGGHISVESELGTGSTFYLYLPASTHTAAATQIKLEALKAAGKARILVMDDEPGLRDVAGRMLKHIGYEDVEFAEHGAEAIKLYKAAMEEGKPFGLAILDLTIAGGMGGEVAIQKLLKIDPGVKAIVSSGYIDDSVIAKFREYGFSGMVAKPYTIDELRKAVQDVIG